jgi:hypothetical protein
MRCHLYWPEISDTLHYRYAAFFGRLTLVSWCTAGILKRFRRNTRAI